MSYKIEAVKELANEIKAAGFRVFIAKSGTYGFYTDSVGTKVVSFQYDLGGFTFSGNYKSSDPRRTGTGWGLAHDSFKAMFAQFPPNWAIHSGCTFKFTTLEQHLKTYQASSQYAELENIPAKDENGRYAAPVSIGTIHRVQFGAGR